MSQEKKVQAPKNQQQAPQAVERSHCKADGCKKGVEKFGFCMEHYDWYMSGLLRGDGQKPIDFEQKYQQYMARRTRKAA